MKHKKKTKKKKSAFETFILFLIFLTDVILVVSCYITQNQRLAFPSLILLQAIFVLLFALAYRHRRFKRYVPFNELNSLTGQEFENLLADYFKRMGYSVKTTPTSGDYGADLILKKHGEKIVVQVKRRKGSVGISAVQEAIGANIYYDGKRAMVITNSRFTASAKRLAEKADVTLWDGTEVAKLIKQKGHGIVL